MNKLPIDDSIAYAIANLVDDAMTERRDPSHSDIEFEIKKANLFEYDPNKPGVSPVGKMKRIRAVLVKSIDDATDRAEKFAYSIIALVKSNGGFREGSPNYVGPNAIKNLIDVLKPKGIIMGFDGSINQVILDGLSIKDKSEALESYVVRAKKGSEDAALVVGTSKDLLEAVAAHVLLCKTGTYPTTVNFPTLLGQAFICLDMATPQTKKEEGEHPRKEIERNYYNIACSINRLRNKQGTGHGRPWMPDVTISEAKEAIQMMGIIADKMLTRLKK
jgi:hypothetical protein